MALSAKKTKSVGIRLTEDQFKYLVICSSSLGQTPSGYLRMVAMSAITACQTEVKKGTIKIEDFEDIINGQL